MSPKQSQGFTSEGKFEQKQKNSIHPIWRGVGIFLMVLIPVLGYVGSLLVINSNTTRPWLRIPSQLIIPGPDPLILVKLILTILIGSFVYFVMMLITFIVYRLFRPSKKNPLDAPPLHWKNRN